MGDVVKTVTKPIGDIVGGVTGGVTGGMLGGGGVQGPVQGKEIPIDSSAFAPTARAKRVGQGRPS